MPTDLPNGPSTDRASESEWIDAGAISNETGASYETLSA
jgi:hypothetical protein